MKRPGVNRRKYYRSIFRRVINRFEEFKESGGYLYSVDGRHRNLTLQGARSGANPLDVKIFISDFMADIELAANRVLKTDPKHLRLFREMYVKGDELAVEKIRKSMTEEAFIDMKHSIQEVLGLAFKVSRIHPVEEYFWEKTFR